MSLCLFVADLLLLGSSTLVRDLRCLVNVISYDGEFDSFRFLQCAGQIQITKRMCLPSEEPRRDLYLVPNGDF